MQQRGHALGRVALVDHILILHEQQARRTLTEWLHHYNHGRPHRGLGQLTPAHTEHEPPTPINLTEHRIRCRAILGGLTHEYWTAATAA